MIICCWTPLGICGAKKACFGVFIIFFLLRFIIYRNLWLKWNLLCPPLYNYWFIFVHGIFFVINFQFTAFLWHRYTYYRTDFQKQILYCCIAVFLGFVLVTSLSFWRFRHRHVTGFRDRFNQIITFDINAILIMKIISSRWSRTLVDVKKWRFFRSDLLSYIEKELCSLVFFTGFFAIFVHGGTVFHCEIPV